MFNRILSLIYKEFLAVWRDKQSRTVLIIPPLLQLILFTYSATLDVRHVPIGILNRDNGKQGFELVQRFHGSPVFDQIIYLDSVEAITPFIDNRDGVMVVSLDEQFSRNIEAGKSAQVQLILDGRRAQHHPNRCRLRHRHHPTIRPGFGCPTARPAAEYRDHYTLLVQPKPNVSMVQYPMLKRDFDNADRGLADSAFCGKRTRNGHFRSIAGIACNAL